jgi:hypothetical protein
LFVSPSKKAITYYKPIFTLLSSHIDPIFPYGDFTQGLIGSVQVYRSRGSIVFHGRGLPYQG